LENNHPDYTIFKFLNDPFTLQIHAVIVIKSKTGDSWFKLLEQMYAQADVAKKPTGKLWAIGQKGLEICFFRFDVSHYVDQKPDCFTNYEPLNLNNLTVPELNNLKVKFEECNDNGFARIALLKWRLDNEDHIPHINDMFEFVSREEP
jgi:hypothetical protein